MYRFSLETSREQILKAENFAELRLLRDQVHEMMQVQPLLSNPIQWHLQLNDMHDWLIQRCITLSEKQMLAQGYGLPPVPYVFVLFGSGGRKEQTLWSDQDNGLIYELTEFQDAQKVSEYFAALTRSIVEALMVLGYPPCEGEVICSNNNWCKSIIEWKQMVQGWLNDPNWEHMRYLLIIEDIRAVYGETSLTIELKKFLALCIRGNRLIMESLLKNTLHRKAALGFFGQLLTERYGEDAGGVDIKYGSYIPIVNGIRLLAIHAGIMETSTLERIEKLLAYKMVTNEQADDWKRALALNLALRSVTPFQVEEGMYSSRGKLSAKSLSKKSRQELKFALHVGIELQKYVQRIVQDEIRR